MSQTPLGLDRNVIHLISEWHDLVPCLIDFENGWSKGCEWRLPPPGLAVTVFAVISPTLGCHCRVSPGLLLSLERSSERTVKWREIWWSLSEWFLSSQIENCFRYQTNTDVPYETHRAGNFNCCKAVYVSPSITVDTWMYMQFSLELSSMRAPNKFFF